MDNYLSLFCVGISLRICGSTDSKLESKVLNINATTLPAGDKYITYATLIQLTSNI